MLREAENSDLQIARATGNRRQLHSLHGLLQGRIVAGQFEVQGQTFRFSFEPATATLTAGRLVLVGRLTVHSPQRVPRSADRVAASLIAIQGGVGGTPSRRPLRTGTQTGQTAAAAPKLEQDRGPETELQPGLHAFESPRTDVFGRPLVDSTGVFGFAGVLYFNLSPLAGGALGVPLDLSRVQLNLRIAPTDDLARDLQSVFSDLTDTLFSDKTDERSASVLVTELNRIFKTPQP